MRDFLIGTFGKFLQVILVIAGIIILLIGLFGGSIGILIGGILLLCASWGVRYALGHIIRHR